MERASGVFATVRNVLNGTAFAPEAETLVLGVVPEKIPAFSDETPALVGARTVELGVRTAAEGVYNTDVVVAFEPAELDPMLENEDDAAAPVALEEALDWMYKEVRFRGSSCHCGWVSRITWYWFSCV